ncbi:MAG: hypothetical protein A2319_03130 [Candidatus Kerfeldbacteria bacterium RIFOXYB2_FULL_38_14]|uniref:Uncharacterized protein n=1 Tax=Candidatus Kerfeldbacteria bacterium RIFOXYB2_FULL_38_14 TaxID=1798547 RepID=A0A1G2BE99_9BACT|nr:MAG: hypothetical protein A2319_03130 [Candidatus Kerfeldbacteria bacterium RIFOXYB2_FULL_38_14]
MTRKFFLVVGWIFIFMVIWSVILSAGVFIFQEVGGDEAVLVFALIAGVFLMGSFVPFLNIVLRKVLYFSGTGVAVTPEALQKILMDINNYHVPVTAQVKKKKIIITWRYLDVQWWEILSKVGLKQVCELHLKFNPQKKEVIIFEVVKMVDWGIGPTSIKLFGGYFRGVDFSVSIGKEWGIKENFSLGKKYSFSFKSAEILNPVLNTILRNGWDVRLAMW